MLLLREIENNKLLVESESVNLSECNDLLFTQY